MKKCAPAKKQKVAAVKGYAKGGLVKKAAKGKKKSK